MFKKLFSKNWLIYSILDSEIMRVVKAYAKGRLIDIGCGDKQYCSRIKPFVSEYVGLDHKETLHDKSKIDLLGTAYEIPVKDECFDTVLCTEVLEHLEEPYDAIKEASRVLKTGGCAIYTVPLYWHLHEEPRDFYRYTKHGLKYLFEKNGFEIIEIKPLSGFSVTFSQELVYYLWEFRRGGIVNPLWWLVPVIGTVIQGIAYILNKVDKTHSFTIEYILVAKKPTHQLSVPTSTGPVTAREN